MCSSTSFPLHCSNLKREGEEEEEEEEEEGEGERCVGERERVPERNRSEERNATTMMICAICAITKDYAMICVPLLSLSLSFSLSLSIYIYIYIYISTNTFIHICFSNFSISSNHTYANIPSIPVWCSWMVGNMAMFLRFLDSSLANIKDGNHFASLLDQVPPLIYLRIYSSLYLLITHHIQFSNHLAYIYIYIYIYLCPHLNLFYSFAVHALWCLSRSHWRRFPWTASSHLLPSYFPSLLYASARCHFGLF